MTRPILHIDSPARYRIRVQGYLDDSWANQLGGMTITTTTRDDRAPVTVLCGRLIDQAAVLGVLNALYGLLLPLLSVECLEIEPRRARS
jgi:hypothetical protein